MANNVGNLTLLGRPLNSSASNASFKTKTAVYKTSEYKITQEIARYDNWSPITIKERATQIANFVVERWKFF